MHEADFYCIDLGSQVKEAVVEFTSRPKEERVCRECGVGIAGEKPVVKHINVEEKESNEEAVNKRGMGGCSIM